MSLSSPVPETSYYISPALWEEPRCYWCADNAGEKVTLRELTAEHQPLAKLKFVKQTNSDYYSIKSTKGYFCLAGEKLKVCARGETPSLFSIHQVGAYVTFAQKQNPTHLIQCEDGNLGNSTDIQVYAHAAPNTTFSDLEQIPGDLFPFLWKLDRADISPRTWMNHENLKDKQLNELAICGTHDSCTWKWAADNYSRSQTLTILEQLKIGVRYLDIRLGMDLETYHGGSNDVNFASVLNDISDFLSLPGSSKETIIMAINRDDKGGKNAGDEDLFAEMVNKIMDGTSAVLHQPSNLEWYTENRVPTLSEVEGHIVLLRRYPASASHARGICLDMWGSIHDNDTFEATSISGVGMIKVQDEYWLTENSTKQGFIASLFPNMISPSDTATNWYINFTSAAKGEQPAAYSNDINPWLGAWLNFQTQLAGTFVMDYPSAALVDRIIRFNFEP